MQKQREILPDELLADCLTLLDRIWNRLAEVDTENCSRDEATEAIDNVCGYLNEVDAERFPIAANDEEDDEEDDN